MFAITLDIREVQALHRRWRSVEREVVSEIRTSVGMAARTGAEIARRERMGAYQDRTGKLTDSTQCTSEATSAGADAVLEATADYASFIHDGTQAHDIYPKDPAGVLHWVGPDGDHFAKHVHHPGTEGHPWLATAAEELEENIISNLEARLPAAVERGLRR